MRLGQDEEAGLWLEQLRFGAADLEWDDGNRYKSLKHDISQAEIEALLGRNFYFAGRILEPDYGEWRGLILGQTPSGRLLALIFTRRDDRIRPITCRPMRMEERKLYAEETEAGA